MWVGGDHPRHFYYANAIDSVFPLEAVIIESRESILPSLPKSVSKKDQVNFVRHFKNRHVAEKKFFGKQKKPGCPNLNVTRANINSKRTVEFIKRFQPDIFLIFGCGLLKDPVISVLPKHAINLHLGLSPRYRGSAGLFWPFYFLEPNHTGATFHYIVSEPDAGDVIHQVIPKLEKPDKIHDVACKTVVAAAKEMIKLLKIFEKKRAWKTHKQKSTGKLFVTKEFMPEHLRVIYNLFQDDMVKHFLEGKIKPARPKLIRQSI